ncbi:hypothetical protein BsWGS_14040 [Bradybaena similaris]
MATHCFMLSVVFFWCLLCLHDTTATDMKFMKICNAGPCRLGEWFDHNKSVCFPCPLGAFMDQQNHQCLTCIPCTKPNELEHEIVRRNCTTTNDTDIGCDGPHYRILQDGFREPICQRCTECSEGQLVEQKCGPDSDTVCVNNILDTTYDKGDSFNVSGSTPYLLDTKPSASDRNTSPIYADDSSANKRVTLTLFVVVLVVIVCAVVFVILFMQRLSLCKALQKLSYHRKDQTRKGQIQVTFESSRETLVTMQF